MESLGSLLLSATYQICKLEGDNTSALPASVSTSGHESNRFSYSAV
jgi:hypothetical protein